MKDFFLEIVESLGKQKQVVLATIVTSDGSSPLPAGAMMLVKSGDGEIAGSVGGGLLEALVIEEAKKYFAENRQPKVVTFDLNDDVSNEGMICGGNVDVLLETLTRNDLSTFRELLQIRNEGSDCVLVRSLSSLGATLQRAIIGSREPNLNAPKIKDSLSLTATDSAIFHDAFRRVFGKDEVTGIKGKQGEIILQPIRGLQNLAIFGGGHISKHLSQIASIAGFSVTVIDDREEFANAERFPGASRVLTSEYDKAFSKIEVKPSTFIVIVTRGHQFDELVLEMAVHTPARYIGMIGSKRKVISCFEDLVKRGVPLEKLGRVHAPIGLDIGATTAEEIAVSIVAELINVRRGHQGPSTAISEQLKEWFGRCEHPVASEPNKRHS
jgi:xanthine dehydrogenase accessory factor